MAYSRRDFLVFGAAAGIASAAGPEQAVKPEQAHKELVDGNRRFSSGHPRHPHSSVAWAKQTARGQHPHALVLCCSDSCVSPEILFDQGIGDLFVVRVAGNVANEDEVASIEYAVEHLNVPLCVVLGHSNCGAVTAVVEGKKLPDAIAHLVISIQSAYKHAKAQHPGVSEQEMIQATVRSNVIETMASIAHSAKLIDERLKMGRFHVEGGVYNLATGRVEWVR